MTRTGCGEHGLGRPRDECAGPRFGRGESGPRAAEIRRREAEARAQEEAQRELDRRRFEERLVQEQVATAERIAHMQLTVAAASAWAAGFAAIAAVMLAATSIWNLLQNVH